MRDILSEFGRSIITGICVATSIVVVFFALYGIASAEHSALYGAIGAVENET